MINCRILYILLLAIFISGCKGSEKDLMSKPSLSNNKTTLKSSANKELIIRPRYEVFHLNDSLSELHFRINSKDLLYTKRDGELFISNCLISYQLSEAMKSQFFLDSSSIRLVDINNENESKYLIGKLTIRANLGSKGYLWVSVVDQNRNFKVNTLIEFDKTNTTSSQNFMVSNSENLLFRNYLKQNEPVNILHNTKTIQTLHVSYYNSHFPLPSPPFSVTDIIPFDQLPDSTFYIHQSQTEYLEFIPSKVGLYHLRADTLNQQGLTLSVFSNSSFPEIKKPEDMLSPLRYITSKDEYDKLESSLNIKLSVENFWLSVVNNDKEKARVLIRKFYSRVQNANENFTSYTEGWRTDRGMIYVVLGKPNSIYRTENQEVWTYTEENLNLSSLSFTFTKVNNIFSNNDFALNRSSSYRQTWFLAVDVWRMGRAYYLEE